PGEQGRDVDVAPAQVGQRLRRGGVAGLLLALDTDRRDRAVGLGDLLRQRAGLGLVQRQLAAVVETHHPLAAVVDGVAVVLLVAAAAVLDLALRGERAFAALQRLHAVHAGVVVAAQQLAAQPFLVCVRGQFQLVQQRARRRRGYVQDIDS